MMRLSLDAHTVATSFEIIATGDVDIEDAEALLTMGILGLRLDPITHLVIDLGGVTFLGSTGLTSLVTLRNAVIEVGKTIELRNPRDAVRKILRITALDGVFPITPADQDATPETPLAS